MFLVPKHLLLLLISSLLFTAHICSVVIAATTASFSHKDHVPCTASLDPQHLIARKFVNDSAYEVIRCSARVGNELFQFANPVFDVSFTSSNGPLSGVFIIRGKNICSPKKEFCWSDFRIPSQALRELLLPKPSDKGENNAISSDDSGFSQNEMTNAAIDFTCNVADASRNTTVRCLDSGSIRYAHVIKFGSRCLNSVNFESECGRRMICSSGRCVCDKGNIPIELSSEETICAPKGLLKQ
ncbi:hypothetical protein TYRP_000525 [Tyrophagus putrescentiae]|nr:hypothetical protein TYRP_000525 [Tyrophagus putrescentiae]